MPREKSTPALVRLSPDLMARIDAWRRQQTDLPTRPEAIRRLVESALAAPPKPATTTARPEPNQSKVRTDSEARPLSKGDQIAALRKEKAK